MKKYFISCIFLFFLVLSFQSKAIDFQTNYFKLSFNDQGTLSGIFDKEQNKQYVAPNQKAPLLSIRCNGKVESPSRLRTEGKNILLFFQENKVEATISVNEMSSYVSFELTSLQPSDKVELVIWGPYPTIISKTIGECVGVVRNEEFAIGIQALNVKTLGGYPSNENDTEPAYNIFSSDNLIDVDESVKFLYRGQTAKPTEYGSILQAYTRNRNEKRIIPNWGHEYYVVPPYDDGGVVGSKIAMFGCPPEKALETIGNIETEEGLPHPTIEGEWAKKSASATASYLIMGFNEKNLDRAIELTQKAGLNYLYHGGPFETWGHFKLDPKAFPDNWESMKRCVERANNEGIKLGVHTLSNFITTNDPYVTPTPDKRLAKVGESVLTKDIDSKTEEIGIASPVFFNQMKNNSLHSVVIGNEIIRYTRVSDKEPWKLEGCVRGAFGTTAAAHKKGDVVGKLMDHGYKVFLSNTELSLEIARRIATLFNQTGLRQISFDGLEGVWSTGMGQYARSMFTAEWYNNLHPELKGKVINDASNPSHFNWHINTRYNWGEPWYAGFRESQTTYRLMNQDFYRRNLLPSMLGWFNMTPQTSIEDTEWLLARAAGFDAGFAFNVSFNAVEKNGASQQIFEAIKTWETARMAGAFSPKQKLKMEDIKNEFHLEQLTEGEWNLFPYHIERFVHEQKIRQPGEPLFSTFKFMNPYEAQPIMFIFKLLPSKNSSGSSVSKIFLEFNNSRKLEIPVEMNPEESLKLGNDGTLMLYDKNWNLKKEIKVQDKLPELMKGDNQVVVDAEFTGEGNSQLEIEMKTVGPAEVVKAPNELKIN